MTKSSRSTMLLKFGSKSALEEDEEPEPKLKTTTVSNSTEGFGLSEDGIKAFEDFFYIIHTVVLIQYIYLLEISVKHNNYFRSSSLNI